MLLASGGLSACGNHHDETAKIQRIENEAFYLSLGELKYQVQISRQLNPNDVQDKYYLRGVPADQATLKSDEVWFGVFLQVENEAGAPQVPSGNIEIVDTQEEEFRPLALDDTNLFAYRSTEQIPPGEILPLKDTPAFDSPIRGSLLLFKLSAVALDNRPLELKIVGPEQTGIIDLDV